MSADGSIVDVIVAALGACREVNGGELESVTSIYTPRGLAVLVYNALVKAGHLQPVDAEPPDLPDGWEWHGGHWDTTVVIKYDGRFMSAIEIHRELLAHRTEIADRCTRALAALGER